MSKQDAGNAASKAYERILARVGATLAVAENRLDNAFDSGLWIQSVTFRMPTQDKPDYLAIVKGVQDDARVIAFHGTPTLIEAVDGVFQRLYNGSLKFKEDHWEGK